MEAIVGVFGVLVGWLLSELSAKWRDIREGRTAATLIEMELRETETLLDVAVHRDGLLPRVPSTAAWTAHAQSLLRWKPRIGRTLLTAYSSVETDVAMLRWFESERTALLAKGDELASRAAAGEASETDLIGPRAGLVARRFEDNKSARSAYLQTISGQTLPQIQRAVRTLEQTLS